VQAGPRTEMIPTILATLRAKLRGLLGDGYRPERHYLRGPGPACRRAAARRGAPASQSAVA
jgi:hypothetical protein